MFGALSFAELGAEIPEAGGEYAYLRRGFGPVWGFLFGWMHSIVGRPSSTASIAAGLMRFVGFLFPTIAAPIYTLHLQLPFFSSHHSEFAFTWAQPLAVLALILMTFINYLGVRLGGQVQIGLTIIKVTSVVAIIVFGFFLSHGRAANFQPIWPTSYLGPQLQGFLAALAAALWVFDGWEDLNLVGSEISDPGRTIPRALIGGVAFVIVLFSVFSAVCFYALAVRHRRSITTRRIGRRGKLCGPWRGRLGHPGDGDFGARYIELVGSQWRSCGLRYGTRRNLFPICGSHSSEISHSGECADLSMLPCQPDGLDRDISKTSLPSSFSPDGSFTA